MLNLKNTLDGYLKNVEVIGNTVQDTNNLADIRSVGDKVEGQELYKIDVVSRGKNLLKFDNNTTVTNGITFVFKNNKVLLKGTPIADSVSSPLIPIKNLVHGKSYKLSLHGGNSKIVSSLRYTNNEGKVVWANNFVWDSSYRDCVAYIDVKSNGISVDGYELELQLEEGTQATSYEPYQEQKLEILSPVQLEKVGDVADKIICKDGVWGVEKNIETIIVTSKNTINKSIETTNHIRFDIVLPNLTDRGQLICNKLVWEHSNTDSPHCWQGVTQIAIFIPKAELETYDVEGCKKWIDKQNQLSFAKSTTQPIFIPLPHDQQVKLRTFAGQTNIAFLTEIPGQIKAQVPKSLGATVNTHTEQIADLHNSLERVKKLEETTVSTVTSDKAFTTVNETNGGYFEDVKIEGRTLVNLAYIQNKFVEQTDRYYKDHTLCSTSRLKLNTPYTFIIDCKYLEGHNSNYYYFEFGGGNIINGYNGSIATNLTTNVVIMPNSGVYVLCVEFKDFRGYEYLACRPCRRGSSPVEGEIANYDVSVLLLEGDHIQNPPSYFEGLMSVGQDVEEVSVVSVNSGNLFDGELELGSYRDTDGTKVGSPSVIRSKNYIPTYGIRYLNIIGNESSSAGQYRIFKYDENKNYLGTFLASKTEGFELESNVSYITFHNNTNGNLNLNIIISSTREGFNDHVKSNKKPLLYYNSTTETWEKPILREWDTIEKRSDGKYYYHKRSGEVVLDGDSEFTILGSQAQENSLFFQLDLFGSTTKLICDRFNYENIVNVDVEGIRINPESRKLQIRIFKSKLSTQDVAGFKAWLKDNPITVVYQLAQEEVYECTNIDLMTYSGETNYIINSGAISPKSLLKVHNNISNVVKILQEKVSLLENTFIAGLKSVLSGDMYSLATILYPEDFEQNDNTEQDIMVIPE